MTSYIKSIVTELSIEKYRIKYYVKGRFKDITSTIKTYPISTALNVFAISFLVLAFSVSYIALSTFFVLMTLDYLDHTYFCKSTHQKSSFWKISFALLFYNLHSLQSHSLLTPEDREELRDDPEVIGIIEKLDLEMQEKQQVYDNDPRPVLLMLKAKSDHNGALHNEDNAFTINGDNDEGVRELERRYKIVLIDEITHIDDIKKGLEKITNLIQLVWISAHGTPTSMLLDGNNTIENSNIDELAPLMQQKLSKDAHVVLYSCSTGRNILPKENIATKFSRILPGRTIWAPKIPTGTVEIDLMEGLPTMVRFWEYKSRLKFLHEKLWNICCLRPFKKIEVECNVTAQIKDGIAYH